VQRKRQTPLIKAPPKQTQKADHHNEKQTYCDTTIGSHPDIQAGPGEALLMKKMGVLLA